MKTLTELFSYIAAVGLLVMGLAAGSVWLLRPNSSIRAEKKVPVIPQKIVESIERKKPVPVDVVAPVRPSVPAMQEAPASLPQPIVRQETIREASSAKSKEAAVGVEALLPSASSPSRVRPGHHIANRLPLLS